MGIIWENSLGVFLLMTVILGGGAAWLAGRALALGWRAYLQAALYMILLAAAVRFFHFALFNGTLLSLHYYLVDLVILLIASALGYRLTRAWQMSTQYPWLYERSGPFSWNARDRANQA